MSHPVQRPLVGLILACAIVVPTSAWSGDRDGATTTLAELARSALANHESVARAESGLRRAQAGVRLASSALLPRLELNGNWTRFREEQAVEFAPGERFVITPLQDWNYSADLSQTLFSGLRDWRARDLAFELRDAAELERTTAAADLVLEVSRAFIEAVAAEQRLGVRVQAEEQAREQLRVARRRFEVGEVPSVDVSRWEARVAEERQQVVVAEGGVELTRRYLARLAGVDDLGQLQPPPAVPAPPGPARERLQQALDQRVELRALDRRLRAAELLIQVEKGAWLPTVDARLQYFVQKSDFPTQDWLSLALMVTVPVYDGGLTAARVAAAREDLAEVELLRQEIERAIGNQVDEAVVTFRSAEAALAAAEERLEASRSAHRQTERAYRVGEASVTDLLTATTELTDAETAVILARWQRELQAIALRHAVGEPPLPDVTLPTTPDDTPVTEQGAPQ